MVGLAWGDDQAPEWRLANFAICIARFQPMKLLILAAVLCFSAVSNLSSVSTGAMHFAFASIDRGRQVLTNRDDFIQRLSSFDRAARLKTDKPVDEAEFLKHVAENVLSFSKAESNLLLTAIQKVKPRLEGYNVRWPFPILLIKTTGREEGNAAYTRGNAIVFPRDKLAPGGGASLERLLSHELFHILSRHNPSLKEALYGTIGFESCAELSMPRSWVWITNPDAPINDHWITLKTQGKAFQAIPILLPTSPTYDPRKGGEFFSYLSFKLLAVDQSKSASDALTFSSENPKLLAVNEVEGYFEQVGMNTDYIIHPEEILAENFALLINDAKAVKSPEILKKIAAVLEKHRK